MNVWFENEISNALQALASTADGCPRCPDYALVEQRDAWRAGYRLGFRAALVAVALAFGVRSVVGDGENVVAFRRG